MSPKRTYTRKKPANTERSRIKFSGPTFEGLAKDLKDGRTPLDRLTVSDDMQQGLRAIVRNTGLVSFHAHYDVDGSRPYIKIGDYPDMTVEQARAITKTIRALADMGIDVQAGLHERLIRELKEKGTKWRP